MSEHHPDMSSLTTYLAYVIVLVAIPVAIHIMGIYIVVEVGEVFGWLLIIAPFAGWVVYAKRTLLRTEKEGT